MPLTPRLAPTALLVALAATALTGCSDQEDPAAGSEQPAGQTTPSSAVTPSATDATDATDACAPQAPTLVTTSTTRELGYVGATALAPGVSLSLTTANLLADARARVVATSGPLRPGERGQVLRAAGNIDLEPVVDNEGGLSGTGTRNEQFTTYAAIRVRRGTWSLPGCESTDLLPTSGRFVAITKVEKPRVLQCYVPVRTDAVGREALDQVCT